MDRSTHEIIKETSKNLKFYIDVRRRENGFVLNPNSTCSDLNAFRTRRGLNRSKPTISNGKENFPREILPNFHRKKLIAATPEKQMCREELSFHLRDFEFLPKKRRKSRFRSAVNSDRTVKVSRFDQDQLIDDAADLLAALLQQKKNNFSTSPKVSTSRSLEASPRPISDLSRLRSAKINLSNSVLSQKSSSSVPTKRSDKLNSTSIFSMLLLSKPIRRGLICQYRLFVTTGDCNGASTSAPIRIKLYGSKGCTEFNELLASDNHKVPFARGQTDEFVIQTFHVGRLIGLSIGHDQKDLQSGWFLKEIRLEDSLEKLNYQITCNSWLSIDSSDQKTMRDFLVTSTSPIGDRHDENKSQSDYSLSNETDRTIPSDQIHRKKQHVSIGPTIIAPESSFSSKNSRKTRDSSTFSSNENLHQRTTNNRFFSPLLSATSSDTEIRTVLANGTRSPTPTPTLRRTGLQSISENATSSQRNKQHRPNTKNLVIDDLDRPPTRLAQRTLSVSSSSERILAHRNRTTLS